MKQKDLRNNAGQHHKIYSKREMNFKSSKKNKKKIPEDSLRPETR